MAKHIDVLGLLFWCYGAFQLLVAAIIVVIYGFMGVGMGAVGISEGEDEMALVGGFFLFFALLLGGLMVVQALLPILAGLGVRRRTNWGRILGIITAALSLMSIPFGTALGIYAFVVLLDKEAAAEFA